MKIGSSNSNTSFRRSRSGFAILIILGLILIMAGFMLANSYALHGVKQELNRIDQLEQKRWRNKT